MLIIFVVVNFVIFIPKVLDEMDFWAGTIGLVLFAFIEIVMFFWIFKSERAWEEINRGGIIKAPRVFYYITKYITPVYLGILLLAWAIQYIPVFIKQTAWNVWVARVVIFILFVLFCYLALKAQFKEETK